jgi:glycoprotein endo-alpha-1,2-mannosidase
MPPPLPRRRLLCALALALLASPATAQRASPSSLRREPSTGEVVAHPHFSARGATLSRPPVVAFYYAWYGNPENDGSYRHWNHAALPHWDAAVNAATFGSADPDAEALAAHVRLEPPQRVHAAFYPERGCYSSVDPNALDAQIEEALAAGIDAFAVSWWGRPEHTGAADSQGVNTDQAVFALVAAAERSIRRRSDPTSDDGDRLDGGLGLAGEGGGMRVAFHLEPYPGRTAETVRADLRYLIDRFGASDALLRGGAERGSGPVFFVYDSYLTAAAEWATLLGPPTVPPGPPGPPSAARPWTGSSWVFG